jgi:hypothetical protein
MRNKEKEELYRRLDRLESNIISLAITVGKLSNQSSEPPSEPPRGTVVLDKHGYAWQHNGFRQATPWGTDAATERWDTLNELHGPLKIIHPGDNVD